MSAIDDRTVSTSTPTEEEEEEDEGGGSPHHEEAIYTLLFQECDKDGSGIVAVDALVQYIQRMQLGEQSPQEEVYDSEEDVHRLQYNLHLLKAMLEVKAVDGMVDLETYCHVIRMWVKDVRDRSGSEGSPQPLEVSQLSDSEDGEAGEHQDYSYSSGHLSRESFETSGGVSSTHNDLDKLELLNSLQDLKLDNKRLQDRNHQLQTQMEHSEEHLREILSDNDDLKLRLKSIQQSLSRLEELQGENANLSTTVHQKQEACQDLTMNVEKLEQEMEELRTEMVSVQSQLTTIYSEKIQLEEEQKALQQILLAKEELVSHQEATKEELEVQLREYQERADELTREVTAVSEENEVLKTENAELQTNGEQRLQQGDSSSRGPLLSSTPYRTEPPSLHEELLAHQGPARPPFSALLEQLDDSQSLEELDSSGTTEDDFSKIIQQAHTQHSRFQQKTDLLVHELNDLISVHPSPSSTTQRTSTTHILQDESFLSFENKLTEYARKKKHNERALQKLRDQLKHLQNENMRLKQQLEELSQRVQEQEASRVETDGEGGRGGGVAREDAGVQTVDQQILSRGVERKEEGVQVGSERAVEETSEMRVDGELHTLLPPVAVEDKCVETEWLGKEPQLVGGEDLTSLKRRQQEFSHQCSQLEQRAKQLEAVQQKHLDEWSTAKHLVGSVSSSVYRVMKCVALVLFILVLLLLLLVLFLLLQDALDGCAGYCPHSPIQFIFSALDPHLQYTRAHGVPI